MESMAGYLRTAKAITIALLAILVLIIVLQNTENVETKILFMTLTMPRAALLFGTGVIGFVIGLLSATRIGRRKSES